MAIRSLIDLLWKRKEKETPARKEETKPVSRAEVTNIQDLVESFKGDEGIAISWKEDKKVHEISFKQLNDRANAYSRGLLELGLSAGDRVAIYSGNNPRWLELDLGINNAAMVDVPREVLDAETAAKFLDHSEARVVFVEDKATYYKVMALPHPNLEHIISMEKLGIEGVMHIDDLYEKGKSSAKELPKADKDSLASIIYTSGTTGEPKGVMLSHYNYMSNLEAVLKRIEITATDRFLSFMPAWHVFERMSKYAALRQHAETRYNKKVEQLISDLGEFKPTIMSSVPRVWELVYKRIMHKASSIIGEKWTQTLQNYINADIAFLKTRGDTPERHNQPGFWKVNLTYRAVNHVLGGNLKTIVSGGSSLRKYLKDFFFAAGLKITEGYGMTETSPIIAGDEQQLAWLYSVGPALEDVQVEIRDGVIFVKGPNVMKGYYKNQKATDEVLNDGWLNTGDTGYFDNDDPDPEKNHLHVTGRIGENFKLANGEWLNPRHLEEILEDNRLVDSAIVFGKDWLMPGVLILPNMYEVEALAKRKHIKYNSRRPIELLENPEIQSVYNVTLMEYLKSVPSLNPYEQARAFVLIPKLDVNYGLSPTRKIQRRKVAEIYISKINELYSKIHKQAA